MQFVIIFAILIAIFLLLALMAPKGYSFERHILINQKLQVVFDYLRDIKNQDYFSKWVMTDPDMNKTYSGKDGEVGFVYAWEGNSKAGKGEQEIKGIDVNKRIDIEVRFEKPMKAIAFTPFTTEAISENTTKVTWGMRSQMKYPANIILLFMNMEKMLGKDVEISLGTLKRILEGNNQNPGA